MKPLQYFYLLQVNDALFPIGGYSHSYGLETYIQKGIVKNTKDAEHYLYNRLKYNTLYTDLFCVRLAWEYASKNNIDQLVHLNQITEAGKLPSEIRDASKKLGSRFLKTVQSLNIPYTSDCFNAFTSKIGTKFIHHACLYGAFLCCIGISQEEALSHYLYAQTSAIVTTCVKSIPLSQTDGQKILSDSYPVFIELLNKVMDLELCDYGLSSPGFDIRCMQHEYLYSRIYMS